MTQPLTPNVGHHVVVNAPIERAFAVFTVVQLTTAPSTSPRSIESIASFAAG